MTIALCVITDGRADYLADTLDAAARNLDISFDDRFIIDDSGDDDYANWLRCNYVGFEVVHHFERRGMAGAVRSGFETVSATDVSHVFWLEDDMFLLDSPPIVEACDLLDERFELAQVTFKREPWWGREVDLDDQLAAIVEASTVHRVSAKITEHDHIFSLNPCVIPRRVFEQGWPDGNEAEQTKLLLDQGFRFAMWGKPHDKNYVKHLGAVRSPAWRL